jgi:protein-tyrosine phosphatase
MEFLQSLEGDVLKASVELVPGRLYWASVDISKIKKFIRNRRDIVIIQPQRNHIILAKNFIKKRISTSPQLAANRNSKSASSPKKLRGLGSDPELYSNRGSVLQLVYTDRIYEYQSLANDFGPLDLPTTLRYVDFIDSLSPQCCIHITDDRIPRFCANTAYLVSVYALMRYEGMTPSNIWEKFRNVPGQNIPPFRDAGASIKCTFPLTIRYFLEAIEKSIKHNWIQWSCVDIAAIEKYQQVEYGDMNWIIENDFIAFAGPSANSQDEDGFITLTPLFYIPHFKSRGISDIVRLNVPNYSPSHFTSSGFRHHDLIFEDGSCPSMEIVHAFLSIVDKAKGGVAVHCKAGLGRSVTLIGAYVIRKYKVSAHVFIAWARIARPGSVIGPQQHFLVEFEHLLRRQGTPNPRKLKALGSDSFIGRNGDLGQATRLLGRKRSAPASP